MQREGGRGGGTLELQLVKESRNYFFFLINTAFNILIKFRVAPRGLVKAEETYAEGNGDVTHFVCLVYMSLNSKSW